MSQSPVYTGNQYNMNNSDNNNNICFWQETKKAVKYSRVVNKDMKSL